MCFMRMFQRLVGVSFYTQIVWCGMVVAAIIALALFRLVAYAVAPSAPSAIALTSPSASLSNDTTPSFTVTVGETGGTVTLYTNSDCSTAASSATTVTDNTSPYTVSVTATALTSDGPKKFYAKHTNISNEASGCSSVLTRYYLDTTNPTTGISEVSGGYIGAAEDDTDIAIEVTVGAGVDTVSLSLSDGTDTVTKTTEQEFSYMEQVGSGISALSLTNSSQFGSAVARQGNLLVVGTTGMDSGTGAVFIIEDSDGDSDFTDATSDDIIRIDNNTAGISLSNSDAFGKSVAIDGTKIAIGAWRNDTGGSNFGSVWLIDDGGNGWADIVAGDVKKIAHGAVAGLTLNSQANFGSGVALSDGVLVVGAPGDNTNGTGRGAIYLIDDGGNDWADIVAGDIRKISSATDNINLADRDYFGSAVALDDGLLAVGAEGDDTGGFNRGAVYLIDDGGNDWADIVANDITKITGNTAGVSLVNFDYFGYGVALSNGKLAVGAIGDGDYLGAVHLIDDGGNSWEDIVASDVTKIDNSTNGIYLGSDDHFGSGISLNNNVLSIGAYGDDTGGYNRGGVYMFDAVFNATLATGDFEKDSTPTDGDSKLAEGIVTITATATDFAGNTGTATKTVDYDITAPTISSMSGSDTTYTITLDEQIYATTAPDADNFTITGGGAPTVSTISGVPSSVATASTTFTATISAALTSIATLAYTQDADTTKRIKDRAGNILATASGIVINPLSATVGSTPTGFATTKAITLSDVTTGAAVKYKLLSTTICNATTYAAGSDEQTVTISSGSGSVTISAESANGKYLCFKLTKSKSNDAYTRSNRIYGIDTTAPTVGTPSMSDDGYINAAEDDSDVIATAVTSEDTSVTADDTDFSFTDGTDTVTKSGALDFISSEKLSDAMSALTLANNDQFGEGVDRAGDILAVSAFHDDTGGHASGAAYIIKDGDDDGAFTDATTNDVIKIDANTDGITLTDYTYFGSDIALGNGMVAIGAVGDDTDGVQRGAVYLIDDGGNDWADIVASDITKIDRNTPGLNLVNYGHFGHTVTFSGNILAVGAPGDNTGGSNRGAVYLIKDTDGDNDWSDTVATDITKISSNTAGITLANGDNLGSGIAFGSDDILAVGALADDTGGTNRGAVYLIKDSGDGWESIVASDVTKINNDTAGITLADNDHFGDDVSFGSDILIVGSPGDDTGGSNRGAVYIIDSGGNQWADIVASDVTTIDSNTDHLTLTDAERFGSSVVLVDGTLVVGSEDDNTGGIRRGAVHLLGIEIDATLATGDFEKDGIPTDGDSKLAEGTITTTATVADRAGNTATATGTTVYDPTLPTISSVASNGTTLTVTMSENVWSTTMPATDDFTISSGNSITISSISGVPSTAANADNSFTLTISPVLNGTATLAYTQNTDTDKRIHDVADNQLASVSSVSITGQLGATVGNVPAGHAVSKTITITNVTSGATVKYKLLNTATCDATAYAAGSGEQTLSITDGSGSVTFSNENQNDTYLCLQVSKAGAHTIYAGSTRIKGIDTVNPSVAVRAISGGSVNAAEDDSSVAITAHTSADVASVSFSISDGSDSIAKTGTITELLNEKLHTAGSIALRLDAEFGTSVSRDGDLLAVGTPADDGNRQGAVYILTDHDSDGSFADSGTLAQKINNTHSGLSLNTYDNFGRSVYLTGNKLVVGAHGARSYEGSVFIITDEDNDNDWTDTGTTVDKIDDTTVANLTTDDNDYFGISVYLSGNILAVGAYGDDTEGANRGAVHILTDTDNDGDFSESNTTVQEINSSHAGITLANDDYFGSGIALDDTMLAIGAVTNDTGGFDRGAVWVLNDVDGDGSWTDTGTTVSKIHTALKNGTNTDHALVDDERLGASIALKDEKLYIGSQWGGLNRKGAVYILTDEDNDNDWTDSGTTLVKLHQNLGTYTLSNRDGYGFGLSVDDSAVVVGAPGDNDGGSDVGAIYMYHHGVSTNLATGDFEKDSTPTNGDSKLAEGTITVTATATDAAGNTATGSNTFVYDQTIPTVSSISPETATALTVTFPENVYGSLDADDFTITGGGAPTVSGITGLGATEAYADTAFTLTLSSALTGTATVSYTQDSDTTKRAMDTAGNTLASFTGKNVVATPAGTNGLMIGTIAGDDRINDTEDDSDVTISGSSPGVPVGTTVTVSLDGSGTDVSGKTDTTDLFGVWSVTVTSTELQALDASTPNAGGETIIVTASATGVSSAIRTFTYDVVDPSTSSIAYKDAESSGNTITTSPLAGTIYSFVDFSESLKNIIANDTTARPDLRYRIGLSAHGVYNSGESFSFTSGNTAVRAIAASNTHFYVTDQDDVKVYGYALDGSYDSTKDFSLDANATLPTGMDVSGSYIYIADNATNKVYVHNLSNGSRHSAKDFALDSGNTTPHGLTATDTHLYVVDNGADKVFVYTHSGTRVSSKEFNLVAANTEPRGITVSDTHIYVADNAEGSDTVYAYNLTDGSHDGSYDFALDSININSEGMTVSGDYAYVADIHDNKAYAYYLGPEEVQYDIAGTDATLVSGDCKPDSDSDTYTCMYTGFELSGSNLFKTFASVYADPSGNAGTAQTYATNSNGVTIVKPTEPTITYTPADSAYITDNTSNITITASAAIYADTDGTAFTNTTIDDIATLKTDDESGTDIDFGATISGNTITIDPDSNLADGVVYVALSDGWYYGTNPTKTQGSASNISFTVDTTAPTFSEVIGGDTTTVTVTMSEDVYATTSPTAADFSVSGGGDPNVTGVAGIPTTKATADNSFTLTLSAVLTGGATLSYTKNSGRVVKDVADNDLETDTAVTLSHKSVSIDEISGGYINDTEDENSLTIEGSSTSLPANSAVTVTLDGHTDVTANATTDSSGDWSVTIASAKIKGLEDSTPEMNGRTITVTATATGAVSGTTSFIYDRVVPAVTITTGGTLDNPAVTATDADTATTTWKRKVITSTESCDSAELATGSSDYTEDTELVIEPDWVSSIVCFSSTDTAGNAGYRKSEGLVSIASSLTMVVGSVPSGSAQSKTINLSSVTSGTTVQYNLITNATCDAASYGSGGTTVTITAGAGSVTLSSESDNGKYLCFKIAKTNYTTRYFGSGQITGIDTTAPSITAGTVDLAADDDTGLSDSDNITKNTTNLTFSGTLSGDAGSGEFVQLYNGTNEISLATDSSFTGTPARNWSITVSLGAGTHAIKAAVKDAAGNKGTETAALSVKVDTTAPIITAVATGTLTNRTVKAADTDTPGTETTWKYKVIESGTTCNASAMSSGTSDYAEGNNQSVGVSAHGKKVCFSSTDVAGHTGYAATPTLSIAGDEPTKTWTPANNSITNDNSSDITIVFSSSVYASNACSTELSNTNATNIVKLGTTSGGNDVAKDITYSATNDTITIDPTSDLADDTYYLAISDSWYYQNGACAQGSEASISFIIDATAPSITIATVADDDRINATEDNSAVTISGGSSGVASGGTITVTLDDSDADSNADITKTDTINGSGDWSVSLTATEVQGLEEGGVTITASGSDNASNTGTQTRTITYDTTAPTITTGTPDLAAADDTGTSNSDNKTKNTTNLSFSGTLSGAATTGDIVQLYNGTNKISGATDSTFTGSNNRDWEIHISLTAGSHSIKAVVIDAAGNEGARSFTLSVTVDTTAPTVTASITGTLTNRTVKGVDTDTPDTETTWKYKVIESGTTCNASAMSSGTSDYTEDNDQSVDSSAHGKKVCFSSTDTAGNIGYDATGIVNVAGPEPARIWLPPNNTITTNSATNVSLIFNADVYSDSACANELTNTTAANIMKLGTSIGGNDIAKTISYTALSNTIAIDPTNSLSNGTVYATLSNDWYYQNGACVQGSADSSSFTVDATAPTVSSINYRASEDGANGLTNAALTDSVYSVIAFSEEVTKVEADNDTARPKIVYKTSASADETQYDIVAVGSTLASGDCKPNSAGTTYICRYTGSGLSGSNLFKSYVTAYTDLATNAGDAQSYSTNTGGVTMSTDTAPTISYTPTNDGYTNDNTANITISSTTAIYADAAGVVFSNTTIDSIITLKEDDISGDDIDFTATISGNAITVNPDSNLADGVVYVAISDGWYYGANPTKTRGSSSNVSFTVDTAAPSVPSAITNKTTSPNNDTTPTFTVTVAETGGTVTLYSDSSCTSANAVSSATAVTDNTSPYKVDVTTNAYSTDGTKTVYASQTDVATNTSSCSTATGSYTLDTAAPTITVTVGGTNDNRTVSAVDNETGTTMKYKLITSTDSCDATEMSSGTTAYTEGNSITIAAADNGKQVCFSSEDAAGNTAYTATAALVTGSGLSATVGSVPAGSAQSKDITISSVTSGASVKYNIITNSSCNATNYGSGGTAVTLSSNSGTVTVTNESDNTKYLCFKVTKTNFSDAYFGSAQITGIDDTPPTLTISAVSGGYVNASEDDSGVTVSGTTAGADTGSDVDLTFTNGSNTETISDISVSSNAWTTTLTLTKLTALTEGTISISGTVDDTAGNSSTATQSFVYDTTVPTVSSITYNSQADGNGDTLTNAPLNGTVYTIITFSENTSQTAANDSTAKPGIWYKTSSSATEVQYDIISSGNLATGDCKAITGTSVYSCMYTGSSLSGSNLFKSYVKSFSDLAGNNGAAQNYSSNTGGVTLSANAAPTISYTPANSAYTNDNTTNITITATSTLYKDSSGTSFSNTDIDDILTLKETNVSGDDIDFTATISGNTITINPDNNLADGVVYVAISNAWYYGVNPTKTQGTASSASFTVDTAAPTATISGQPTNTNNTTTLAVTVAGTGVTHYKHKTVTGSSCTATGYGSETAVATTITDNISSLSDGSIILCVLGKDAAGNWQTTATSATWTKDTTAPTITTTVGGTNDNRTVSATDNESGTSMKYKLITSTDSCDATEMSSGTTAYTEGNSITIAAADNGKKVCFSSEDTAGNSSYIATAALVTGSALSATVGSVPSGQAQSKDITISSVTSGAAVKYKIITNSSCNATNYGSGGTTVTLSSNSGTVTVTNESDNTKYLCFKVTKTNFSDAYFGSAQITGIDDTAPTATISGAPSGTNNTTTLAVTVAGTGVTHYKHKTVTGSSCTATGYGSETAVATNITDTISSLADGSIILCVLGKDAAGNWQTTATSASWTKDTSAPTLTISAVSGGYVNATEDNSGVTVSGTTTNADSGSDVDLSFTNSSNTTTINDISVSSNTWTTTLTLTQLTTLSEGTIAISGTVDDTAGNTSTATQSFVYDITAPTITTTVGGTNDNRTVSATDNESGTSMKYKLITSTDSCDATEMSSGTTAYTEGNSITIAAADNGKKVCFSSEDSAGNSSYTATAALVTGSALSATVGSVPSGQAQSKDITISSVTTGAAVTYNLITNSSCNATNYGSGGTTVTLSSNSGTVTVTNESDNTKYLCFKVTKTNFSDAYFGSAQITGIDDTAPTAPSAITNKTTSPNNDTTPTFTVTVAETGGTVTLYSDSSCTSANAVSSATAVTDNTSPYKVDVTTNAYSTDGTKTVYAQHTDAATNTSSCSTATGSYTLDTTAPTATITGQPTNTNNTTTLSVTVAGTGVTHYKHKTVTGTTCTATGYGSETAIATSITDNISSLSDGSIILCVLGRDSVGNWQTTATSASWTKDTTAPTITTTIAGTPAARTVSASDNDAGTTAMLYKLIDGTDSCDATEMANDTESYTEGSSKAVTGASNNGKKACFSSTDVAGNTAYTATAALTVAGGAPTTTWTPANNGYLTSLSGSITLVFGSDVYSNNTCTTELTNTTADNAVTLGTTNSNNNIATTVTYTAASNTITITPDSNLTDNTTYYAGVTNAWYYQNGACAQGAAESISFTTDATAPTLTISAVSGGYVNAAEDNSGVTISGTTTNADSTSDVDLTFTNGSNTTTISDITVSSNTWTTTLTLTQLTTLTEGTISISGTVDDRAGNTSTATQSFIYDITAPTLAISAVSGGYVNSTEDNSGVTVSGTTTGADTGSDVDLSFTNGSNTQTISDISVSSNTWTTTLTLAQLTALSEGTIAISGTVDDSAGNTATATQSFVYDTTSPTATLSGAPSGTNNTTTLAVTVAGTGVTHYKHKVVTGSSCTATGYGSETAVSTSITDTISSLSDGSIILCVLGRDTAGNYQTTATSASWTKDTTAPTITTTVAGTNDNRTVSAVDNDTGATMEYKIITSGTSCNATTMASGATAYTEGNSITIAAADNGKKVCFSSEDSAGNTAYTATATLVTGSGLSATVGSVPSGQAQSKDITISSVTTGAAVTYNLITNSSCNATNYGSGGTTVTLSSNSGTVTVTNESDNTKYLCFKVTKTNFSDAYFGSAQITGIDDTAPTAPSAITNKTTSPNNDTTPTFTVTVAETGGTVTLYSDSSCTSANAVSSATAVTDNTSPYKVDVTTNAYSTDGTKTVYAQHTDAATNTSSCSTATGSYTLDTTAPTATITGQPTNTNNTTTLSVTVAGTGVTHYKHKTVTGTTCTATGYGSETAIATSITDNISSLSDGSIILCVLGRDSVGNWQTTATSASWTKDTAAPTTPTGLDLSTDDDTGSSATDNLTNKTAGLTIVGCAEANVAVQLYRDGAAISGATDTADGATGCTAPAKQFSIDIALAGQVATYAITAKASDEAGNTSSSSTALNITVDTTPPASTPGTIDLATTDDTGYSDNDNITKNTADLSLSGTLSADAATGEYVQLYQGGTAIASATDSSFTGTPARNWAIDIDLANRATPYQITASVLDAAGNAGTASAALSLTVDASGGSGTATTPDLNATDDTGISATDNITNKTTGLTFSGTTAGTYKNDYVQLYNGGTAISGALSAVFGADGTHPWNITTPLGVGTHTIAARIFDLAGNQSTGAISAALPVTIETTPPVISAPAVLITTEGTPYDLSNGVVTITGSEASQDTISAHAATIGIPEVTIEATDTAGNMASITRSMVVLPQAVVDAGGTIGTVRVVDNDTDLTGSIGYPSGVTPAYTGVFEWRDSSYVYLGATETTVPTTIGYTVTENADGYGGYRSVTEVAVDVSAQSGKQFTNALIFACLRTLPHHTSL